MRKPFFAGLTLAHFVQKAGQILHFHINQQVGVKNDAGGVAGEMSVGKGVSLKDF